MSRRCDWYTKLGKGVVECIGLLRVGRSRTCSARAMVSMSKYEGQGNADDSGWYQIGFRLHHRVG